MSMIGPITHFKWLLGAECQVIWTGVVWSPDFTNINRQEKTIGDRIDMELEREMAKLRRWGVDPPRLREYEVLCLPATIDSAESAKDLLDTLDSMELGKRLKAAGLKCANSLDLDIRLGVKDSRSADIWLGCLWILEKVALPVAIGVLLQIIGQRVGPKPTGPTPDQISANVHLKLRIPNGESLTEIDYEGDGATLTLILNAVKEKNVDGA